MTKRKENDDELRAQNWLRQQGYKDIRRPHSDPPDFVVDSKYAVEVTRLHLLMKLCVRMTTYTVYGTRPFQP